MTVMPLAQYRHRQLSGLWPDYFAARRGRQHRGEQERRHCPSALWFRLRRAAICQGLADGMARSAARLALANPRVRKVNNLRQRQQIVPAKIV